MLDMDGGPYFQTSRVEVDWLMDGLMELEELFDNSPVEVDRSRTTLDRVVRFGWELERSTPFAGCGFICHKLVSLVVLNIIYDCCLLREESRLQVCLWKMAIVPPTSVIFPSL
jgi:hypothetical protein